MINTPKLIIAILFLIVALYALVPEIRHQLRIVRSQSWPTVYGTVQKGEVLHSGPGKYLQLPFRSLLGYAYKVDTSSHWGLFAVPVKNIEEAEVIQKQAVGKLVTVKYDPRNPEISLLVDKELFGRRITQNPTWLSQLRA